MSSGFRPINQTQTQRWCIVHPDLIASVWLIPRGLNVPSWDSWVPMSLHNNWTLNPDLPQATLGCTTRWTLRKLVCFSWNFQLQSHAYDFSSAIVFHTYHHTGLLTLRWYSCTCSCDESQHSLPYKNEFVNSCDLHAQDACANMHACWTGVSPTCHHTWDNMWLTYCKRGLLGFGELCLSTTS